MSGTRSQADGAAAVRVDKWLWAARFFKSRSEAARAVDGGKVHVNGARVKAARSLHVGDSVSVQKGPYAYHVTVQALAERRGPAPVARTLYAESDRSIAEREALQAQRRLAGDAPHPARRPDKKARRQLRRFVRGE
ncbi:MAG TPA: S4 domain-containing protein [Gammaproteobacteria bacterium]|nr:S4 domain-containing protein [Gammaproteobacteria bacterium]